MKSVVGSLVLAMAVFNWLQALYCFPFSFIYFIVSLIQLYNLLLYIVYSFLYTTPGSIEIRFCVWSPVIYFYSICSTVYGDLFICFSSRLVVFGLSILSVMLNRACCLSYQEYKDILQIPILSCFYFCSIETSFKEIQKVSLMVFVIVVVKELSSFIK